MADRQKPKREQKRRRGVLLLVILSILVLFALIGITFVVVSTAYRRVATDASSIGRSQDEPRKLLDGAMYQLLRGPRLPESGSVLYSHSLLEDLYGYDGFKAAIPTTISTADVGTSGQILRIGVSNPVAISPNGILGTTPGYYAGCVFTVTSGPASGQSTRIVRSDASYLYIEMFNTDRPFTTDDLQGAQYVVNGRPFNGTGASAGINGAATEAALAVNRVRRPPNTTDLAGGVDESWDAPDHLNMFMAFLPPTASTATEMIPSFHREALLSYSGSAAGDRSHRLLRAEFAASRDPNPAFPPFPSTGTTGNYAWDVDNDGDGMPDSIWIDLGYPPRHTADGRTYKPMFAFLCLDMDGRFNLNAHGNEEQLDTHSTWGFTTGEQPSTGAVAPAATLPGFGFGPAEVDLTLLLSSDLGPLLDARHAGSRLPIGSPLDSQISALKTPLVPSTYPPVAGAGVRGAYGSPPDVFGHGRIALDRLGNPLYAFYHGRLRDDDPYEINLLKPYVMGVPTDGDTPFTETELEPILRYYDIDKATLPSRLLALLTSYLDDTTGGGTFPSAELQNRRAITTRSSDIPAPNVPGSPVDLFRGNTSPLIVPFELLHGQKMDLNRPLVADDPSNPTAWPSGDTIPFTNPQFTSNVTLTAGGEIPPKQLYAQHLFCLLMALEPNTTDELTIQRRAQWAVNVVDFRDPDGIMTPFEYDPNPFDGWNETADGDLSDSTGVRVVWGCEYPELLLTETLAFHDRRCRDTADEAADDPVEGDTGGSDPAKPGVGMRKELKPGAPAGSMTPADFVDVDSSLDQVRAPRGALYLELYCPRGIGGDDGNQTPPVEFYPGGGAADQPELAVTNTAGVSIWRIAIGPPRHEADEDVLSVMGSDPEGVSFEPEDLDMRETMLSPVRTTDGPYDRLIYFGQAPTNHGAGIRADVGIYLAQNNTIPVGGYGIVGPRISTNQPIRIGLPKGQDTGGALEIALVDGTGFSVQQGGSQAPSGATVTASQVSVFPAASSAGMGISVSEPLTPYPAGVGSDTEFADPEDLPYDEKNDFLFRDQNDHDLQSGLKQNFTYAFLQRLADPNGPDDRQLNPYITVDWMPIDLTVFNSEYEYPATLPGAFKTELDPREEGDDPEQAPTELLSVRKGIGTGGGGVHFARANYWTAASGRTGVQNTTGVYPKSVIHTFGNLNDLQLVATSGSGTGAYRNAPQEPFPWLTWHNRPFANAMELLMVPASTPGRLLFEMGYGQSGGNLYSASGDPFELPFGYLLNFCDSSPAGEGPSTSAPNYFRLFELVEVPSPFVGTEKWYSPDTFAAPNSDWEAETFWAPFNRMSLFRDPGKVNLNTMADGRLYRAVIDGGLAGTASEFVKSRRGYASTQLLGIDSSFPSRFANPFRSGFAQAPIPDLNTVRTTSRVAPVDGTLLRRQLTGTTDPLLMDRSAASTAHDPERHAFFRYQRLMRLGNMTTTHSNVYAVWITVGFFEYEAFRDPGDRLGRELGSDTGEVQRHRAFYMIDRSIPVAFEPGENHNVDQAVIIRRFIE